MDILKLSKTVSNEQNAFKFLKNLRWSDGLKCSRCNSKSIVKLKDKRYLCLNCKARFSDLSGTYLSSNKIPFDKLILAVKLFVLGLSALETSGELNLNYKTVLSLFDTMRLAIFHFNSDDKSQLSGEIEVDMRPILVAKGMVNKAEVHLIKYQFLG